MIDCVPLIYSRDDGAYGLDRAHSADAGLDLRLAADAPRMLKQGEIYRFDTGIHVIIPVGWCGLIMPRSSSISRGIEVLNGVVDAGYTGSIKILLRALQEVYVCPGEAYAQLVVVRTFSGRVIPGNVAAVRTERSGQGFGSSGL